MTAPTQRQKATWTVYQQHTITPENHVEGGFAIWTVLLEQLDDNVTARTAAEACWHIAETELKDAATSGEPPVLTASRNGTQHGLNEARPYALKPTVERVK